MNSIRRKLLLTLIAAISLVLVIGAWATYGAAREEANSIFDYHLEQIALAVRDQDFSGNAGALAGDERLEFVLRIWDRNGLTIYYSRPHGELPDVARMGFSTERTARGAWRIYAVQHRGQTIAVAQPMSVRARIAASAALRTLTPFAVLLPLAALLIWFVVGRELRPLTGLAGSVARRTPDALDPIAETGVPDEALPLVRALNDLLTRLQGALKAQRDFIADAAHELRTPLAALQLQAQLIERATDDTARHAGLADLRAGLERATHVVSQLLTLARAEPGAEPPAPVDVRLVELCRQSVVNHAALAAAGNIDLGFAQSAPDAAVAGQPDALRTLLDNLVANAVRYTPPGGRVDVACGMDGASAWLEVQDNGPGIPPAERARVFDRFYRRAGESAGGSGLGLAIVRAIARRHGAEVVLDDAPGGGLRARVVFPKRA
ncbi:ATP-binding protein [Dechloromonas sp. H13]|uniref:ATP-binding protein n=1 Tax=Dechloromonas sp. H13 TaxID=2570193 RepID=UPI00129259F7|nr:ATP-binding protein [Dechloromonas sp. H13]